MDIGLGLWGVWLVISVVRVGRRFQSEPSTTEGKWSINGNIIVPILLNNFTIIFGGSSILHFAIFLEIPSWTSTNFVRLALIIGIISIVLNSTKREKRYYQ